MAPLPIIQRELLVRARNPASRRLRLGAALAGMLICLAHWRMASALTTPGAVGRSMFDGLVGAAFVLCCAACLLTADAIGSERRGGTLGLLFLTRVRGPDVLLGKLGANGLDALGALAALLPLLLIPVLLGGVTGGEAGREGLALLGALVFALAAGLVQSASHERPFRALVGAVALMLAVVLLPAIPVLSGARHTFWAVLGLFSPLSTMLYASDALYSGSPSAYWLSLAVVQAMAWLLVARASFRLRGIVTETGGGQRPAKRSSSLRSPRLCVSPWPLEASPAPANPPVHPSIHSRRCQTENPVEWLVRRQPGLRAAIWTAVLGMLISQLCGVCVSQAPAVPGGAVGAMVSGLPWAAGRLLCWAVFAWAASRYFIQARRTGELELLLTTPLGAWQIVAGQWRALRRLLFAPALVLAAAYPIELPIRAFLLRRLMRGAVIMVYPPWWALGLIWSAVGIASTALGLAALCWLGFWFGLKSASQPGAILRTLAVGQVAPYAIGVLGGLVNWRLNLFLLYKGSVPAGLVWIQWFPQALILLYFAWLIRWAVRRLAVGLVT